MRTCVDKIYIPQAQVNIYVLLRPFDLIVPKDGWNTWFSNISTIRVADEGY
jgi:hypothetical protein